MSRQQPFRAVKGMRDILPPESGLWWYIEEMARHTFREYGYKEIRTPLVEVTELFARSVGQDTDIVTKEMYTWEDRDQTSLTLRPEATASVVRAYLEHRLYERPGVKKFWYMGPMFRRERPQKGRYRQFYQIGAEAIGSESPTVDAEMIEMLVNFLGSGFYLDLNFDMWLNSVGCKECRPRYIATLREELARVRDQLCEDCQRRSETNPLRVLDCKVPEDQPIIERLPMLAGSLCEACRTHFERLQGYLRDRNIPFIVQPRLVRGLDYYTRTTFEFVHGSLGAQNSLLGGGRYDGLSEDLGGPPAPGIGFSIGEDRLALVLEQQDPLATQGFSGKPFFYVVWLGEDAYRRAAELARAARSHGACSVELAADAVKLKKSLETASKLGAHYVVIVGEQELAEGRYTVRQMATGEQQKLTVEGLLNLYDQYIKAVNKRPEIPVTEKSKPK